MSLQIDAIKAFEDNYIWAIHNQKQVILVDPGDSEPVEKHLETNGLDLVAILITHHHHDHIGGVKQLMQHWNCDVYGPQDKRLDFEHHVLKEGNVVEFENPDIQFKVVETPGHTLSHICYHNNDLLFSGDTLFSMGCGRMFEGTAEQFNHSLNKLKSLDPSLKVYCTHEYTLSNLLFALSLEPNNPELINYKNKVTKLRHQGKPSLPSILQVEKELNPFLRTDQKGLQDIISKKTQFVVNNEIDCFYQLRHMKDIF